MTRRNLRTALTLTCVFGAICWVGAARVRADDETRIRWDIITLTAGPTVHPGGQASANDNIDGPITPSCDHASGSNFPVGQTTLTCSATDHTMVRGTS